MGKLRATPRRGRQLTDKEFAHFKSMAIDLRVSQKMDWTAIAKGAGYKGSKGPREALERGSGSLYYYERLRDFYNRKRRGKTGEASFEVPDDKPDEILDLKVVLRANLESRFEVIFKYDSSESVYDALVVRQNALDKLTKILKAEIKPQSKTRCIFSRFSASIGTSISPLKNCILGKYFDSAHASTTNPTNPINIDITPLVNNCQPNAVWGHGILSGGFLTSIPNTPAIIHKIPAPPINPKPGVTNNSTINSKKPTTNNATSTQFAIPIKYLLPIIITKHITATKPGSPTPGELNST